MMCSSQFCHYKGDERQCKKCGPVNIAAARQLCLNADIVVIKLIRLCSLESLKDILQDTTLDLKVSLELCHWSLIVCLRMFTSFIDRRQLPLLITKDRKVTFSSSLAAACLLVYLDCIVHRDAFTFAPRHRTLTFHRCVGLSIKTIPCW